MNFVSIATLLHITVYLFYTGVIPSISDSYRTIDDKRLYHAFFIVFGALVALQGIYSPDRLDIPYVIAGFCIYGLSLAAEFWKKEQGWLHVAFTYTAIVIGMTLTVLWMWPTWGPFFSLIPVIVLATAAWVLHDVKNATYWQEVAAVICIYIPILKI